MPKVEAEFLERQRVVFNARGRSSVNARGILPDGPIGYTSGELLLIALANCSLGVLTNHELLKGVAIRKCTITLEGETEANPARTTKINAVVDLQVDDDALGQRRETLERAIDHCPIGNTLRFSPEVTFQLRISSAPSSNASARPEPVEGRR